MSKIKVFDGVSNKIVDADVIRAAERLIKLKKQNKLWETIEEIIKVWIAKNPSRWDAVLIHLDDIKGTRRDRKFATGKGTTWGSGQIRYLVDIPQEVILMIRTLYTSEELPMNKEFFREFAKRFEKFRIPEKI